MGIIEIIVIVAILLQIMFTVFVVSNFHYAKKELNARRIPWTPPCTVIVPCKGLEETFDENIQSFFEQDYENYHLFFVVQDRNDPAYHRLLKLKAKHRQNSLAKSVQILISGPTQLCSQKLHNLLFAARHVPEDSQVLVFADSDACVGSHWLIYLTEPLFRQKNGATSGYRCFIPKTNNLATIALSALNLKVCQLLGNMRYNLAWGGSMAIPVKNFRDFQIDRIWEKSLSDDLSLTAAVRRNKRKMVFVPQCMTATFEATTWKRLFEFTRRQFIITRIYAPMIWLLGLLSSVVNAVSLWGSIGLALWAQIVHNQHAGFLMIFPVIIFCFQLYRAILRNCLIDILLPQHREQMKMTRYADLLLFWLWTILMIVTMASSIAGKTITWRKIRYRLDAPDRIHVFSE